MCNACKNLSKVWNASQELLVTRFTSHKTGYPTFLLVKGNDNPQSVTIAVKYCPWCGERLIGEYEIKQTNADKYFRNATDEEIAKYMANGMSGCHYDRCKNTDCYECWLNWLKQEVKDDA